MRQPSLVCPFHLYSVCALARSKNFIVVAIYLVTFGCMNGIRELTKAEEQVMQVLWQLQKTSVHSILEQLPEPRPAYNTVSTIVRILEQKGFVGHESAGRAHLYFPLITQDAYREFALGNLVSGYFQGSLSNLVSFFAEKENLSLAEVDEITRIIEQHRTKS
jgi:predicted transcriptional regulator